jgi:hypothetical protein
MRSSSVHFGKCLTIGVAAAVLGLTGCTTTHDADPLATSTQVPVDPTFVTTANTACTAAVKNIAQRKFPYVDFNPTNPNVSELPGIGAFYDSSKFSHDELTFVQGLGQPATGKGTWKAFVDQVGQEQTELALQISAAKASNKTAFVESVNRLATIETRIDSLAVAAGFAQDSDCITLFG